MGESEGIGNVWEGCLFVEFSCDYDEIGYTEDKEIHVT